MPRKYARKTFRKKRNFRKRGITRKAVTRIARHMVRKTAIVRRVQTIGTEVSIPILTKLGGTNIMSLFDTVQGVGAQNRIGAAIKVIGIRTKFLFTNNRTDTVFVRMSLLRVSGAAALSSVSNIFETATAGETSITNSVACMILPYQKDDVKVLYNKVIKLSPYITDQADSKMVSCFVKQNFRLKYNSSGTTSTNFRYFWIVYSSDASNDAVSGDVEWTYYVDQWFTDSGNAI